MPNPLLVALEAHTRSLIPLRGGGGEQIRILKIKNLR
jgi:hypothetical protein